MSQTRQREQEMRKVEQGHEDEERDMRLRLEGYRSRKTTKEEKRREDKV